MTFSPPPEPDTALVRKRGHITQIPLVTEVDAQVRIAEEKSSFTASMRGVPWKLRARQSLGRGNQRTQ